MAIYTQCGCSPKRNSIPDSSKTMGPSVFFSWHRAKPPAQQGTGALSWGLLFRDLALFQPQAPEWACWRSPLRGMVGLWPARPPRSLASNPAWPSPTHPLLDCVQLRCRETFPLVSFFFFFSFLILNTLECTSASYLKAPDYFGCGQFRLRTGMFSPKKLMLKHSNMEGLE